MPAKRTNDIMLVKPKVAAHEHGGRTGVLLYTSTIMHCTLAASAIHDSMAAVGTSPQTCFNSFLCDLRDFPSVENVRTKIIMTPTKCGQAFSSVLCNRSRIEQQHRDSVHQRTKVSPLFDPCHQRIIGHGDKLYIE